MLLIRLLQHAFDSAGRLYNQNGKLEEWWTNKTSEGFKVRQKCIVDQYSSTQLPTVRMRMLIMISFLDYTVEDGKGGVIHVNVGSRLLRHCLLV